MITILLTRSDSENKILKSELNPYNFDCIEFPLVKFEEATFDYNLLKNYSHVIITSKYAAKIIARDAFLYNKTFLKFWVVGEISASILREADLNIEYIAKNAQDLMQKMPTNISKNTVYLSGNEITQHLSNDIKRYIIYNTQYKKKMLPAEIKFFENGINYILLYSQNCAKTLISLMKGQNLLKSLENTTVITISLKVAKQILPYSKKILYCKEGEHNKMIELLITHAKNRKSN